MLGNGGCYGDVGIWGICIYGGCWDMGDVMGIWGMIWRYGGYVDMGDEMDMGDVGIWGMIWRYGGCYGDVGIWGMLWRYMG